MIKIDSITATDFMQYRTLRFKVKDGVHSVVGKNRSGKSSIYEALLWGMTGTTARGDKKVTRRGATGANVEICGTRDDSKFTISRTEGKSLKFWVDDAPVEMGTMPLNQKRIEEFLGMNPTLILGCTLFGHNSFRLTRAGDAARKELLEEIVDVERFHNAKERALIEAQELDAKIRNMDAEMNVLGGKIEELLDKEDEAKTKEIKTLEDRLSGLLLEEKGLLKRLPKVDMPPSGEIKTELTKCLAEKDSIGKLLTFINYTDVCPTCTQPISNASKNAIRERSRVKVKDIDVRLKVLSSEFTDAQDKERVADALTNVRDEIAALRKQIEKVKRGDTDLLSHIAKQVKDMQTRISSLSRQTITTSKKLEMYKFWQKGFSRQGVISLLMDSVIDQLNAYALEAADGLTDGLLVAQMSSVTTAKSSGNVTDRISLEVMNDGEMAPYTSLSNSEQQRVDMIMMFAWQRLMEQYAGMSFDVAFFDEIFEGLDADSMGRVLNYIVSTRKKLPTYIISHMPDISFSPASVIRVTRSKGGSHIEEED